MFTRIIALFVVACLFTAGCQANNDTAERIRSKKVVPNTQEAFEEEMTTVKNDEYKQYIKSLEKGIADEGYKQELFSSDEQRQIEQHISHMEDVLFVYTEIFDEQLNISVSVRKGHYEEMEDEIYDYLEEHFPGRNVEVFIVQATG